MRWRRKWRRDPVEDGPDKAVVYLECPECGQRVPVSAHLGEPIVTEGNLTFDVIADTDDVWAHAWTHDRHRDSVEDFDR